MVRESEKRVLRGSRESLISGSKGSPKRAVYDHFTNETFCETFNFKTWLTSTPFATVLHISVSHDLNRIWRVKTNDMSKKCCYLSNLCWFYHFVFVLENYFNVIIGRRGVYHFGDFIKWPHLPWWKHNVCRGWVVVKNTNSVKPSGTLPNKTIPAMALH